MRPLSKHEQRYQNDAAFRSVVDALMYVVETLQMTPSEVREAAVFACVRIEMARSTPIQIECAADPKRAPGEPVVCANCGGSLANFPAYCGSFCASRGR